jgi:hypothetical protein
LGIRPELYLPTRVRHMIGVMSSDQSRAYDRSCVFRLESGMGLDLNMQPESRLLPGVVIYLHYKHV